MHVCYGNTIMPRALGTSVLIFSTTAHLQMQRVCAIDNAPQACHTMCRRHDDYIEQYHKHAFILACNRGMAEYMRHPNARLIALPPAPTMDLVEVVLCVKSQEAACRSKVLADARPYSWTDSAHEAKGMSQGRGEQAERPAINQSYSSC